MPIQCMDICHLCALAFSSSIWFHLWNYMSYQYNSLFLCMLNQHEPTPFWKQQMKKNPWLIHNNVNLWLLLDIQSDILAKWYWALTAEYKSFWVHGVTEMSRVMYHGCHLTISCIYTQVQTGSQGFIRNQLARRETKSAC